MKRILLKVSIIASRHSNCLAFEDEASIPIFPLKWSKNRAPLLENTESDEESICIMEKFEHFDQTSISVYKEAIYGYIGGFIIKKLLKRLSCSICYSHLISDNCTESFLSLINLKDRGGLLYPSADVVKIIRACEIAFKCLISGDDFKNPKILNKSSTIKVKMRNNVIQAISGDVFNSLEEHDFDIDMGTEDLHSLQLTKAIVDIYLNIRLLRYGQYYTEMVLKKSKCGVRQQSNKLVLFQGL